MTFRTLRRRLARPLANTSGQGMTEYIVIVALIAIAAIGAVSLFGDKVRDLYSSATQTLDQKVPSKGGGSAGGIAPY